MIIKLLLSENGQGMVEYGLVLGLISIVCIAALTATGGSVSNLLGSVSNTLGNTATEVAK